MIFDTHVIYCSIVVAQHSVQQLCIVAPNQIVQQHVVLAHYCLSLNSVDQMLHVVLYLNHNGPHASLSRVETNFS